MYRSQRNKYISLYQKRHKERARREIQRERGDKEIEEIKKDRREKERGDKEKEEIKR
jgi:hypothetical protein